MPGEADQLILRLAEDPAPRDEATEEEVKRQWLSSRLGSCGETVHALQSKVLPLRSGSESRSPRKSEECQQFYDWLGSPGFPGVPWRSPGAPRGSPGAPGPPKFTLDIPLQSPSIKRNTRFYSTLDFL